MAILFTSDWQAEWNTLDLCQQALEEVLNISKKQDVDLICFLGDLKQAYNPVDIRIIKWWKKAFSTIVKAGLEILVLKGNHDRVGTHSSSDTWLSIFNRKGVYNFDKPGTFKTRNSVLHILPYCDNKSVRQIAAKQRQMADPRRDILLFHHDLTGAKYNKQGSKSNAKLSPRDLFCSSYRYCIGGHIHLPQVLSDTEKNKRHRAKKSNVYYVGSPFCHDWGEINQQKRYLVVGKSTISSIDSKIPRWFDPSVAGFSHSKPETWRGSRIRIQVPCDASQDYGRRLEKARLRAENEYKGATVYVVPKFIDHSRSGLEGFSATDSDERKIKQYVSEMATTAHIKQSRQLIAYMLEKLAHFAGGLRPQSKVKFVKAIGHNFLSFKKLKLDFTQKGITLIQGINEDRVGKSNGSGKTSLMQPLPVALFGKTFKEQKHDSWANRHIEKEPAFAEVVMDNGKHIKVVRGRRPPLLRMYVDGKEVSSGMKTTDREGTQLQIEKVTGFTWQTLANAVYIDRTVADAFLSGTKKQRTDVLSRFQNLERFEKALELVKKDKKAAEQNVNYYDGELHTLRGKLVECKRSLNDIQEIQSTQVDTAKQAWNQAKHKLYHWSGTDKVDRLKDKVELVKKEYKKALKHLRTSENKLSVAQAMHDDALRALGKWKKLSSEKNCPTCQQSVDKKHAKKITYDLKKKLKFALHMNVVNHQFVTKWKVKVQDIEGKHDELNIKISKLEQERRMLKMAVQTAWQQYSDMDIDTHNTKVIIHKKKIQIKELQEEKQAIKDKLKSLRHKMQMYNYAMEAFSRDGIPAFLNKLLCPILNKAADYYAELFSDREIQVQFIVEKGEFVPKIINDNGGEEIKDQSEGEKALAGLISSFALREAAPQCNVLFLDEPGAGLDQQTAKQFARALRKLTKRFGSIYVATHNVDIASELGNEKTITVRKHRRISKILEAA